MRCQRNEIACRAQREDRKQTIKKAASKGDLHALKGLRLLYRDAHRQKLSPV